LGTYDLICGYTEEEWAAYAEYLGTYDLICGYTEEEWGAYAEHLDYNDPPKKKRKLSCN